MWPYYLLKSLYYGTGMIPGPVISSFFCSSFILYFYYSSSTVKKKREIGSSAPSIQGTLHRINALGVLVDEMLRRDYHQRFVLALERL